MLGHAKKLKMKECKKICSANTSQRKAGVGILISNNQTRRSIMKHKSMLHN